MSSRLKVFFMFVGIYTVSIPSVSFAWDGYDSVNGDSVTIDTGNLVRPGETIEVYNNTTGNVEYSDVMGVYDNGASTTVETYNNSTGEVQYLEMNKD